MWSDHPFKTASLQLCKKSPGMLFKASWQTCHSSAGDFSLAFISAGPR